LAVVTDHVFSKLHRSKVTVWLSSLTAVPC
jgi:hypothetical protein